MCNCVPKRIAYVNAKCSDLCFVSIEEKEHDGYVPEDMGIGEDDCIDFSYCLSCGKIEGSFPLPLTGLEKGEEE